jgi:hypothetical protein
VGRAKQGGGKENLTIDRDPNKFRRVSRYPPLKDLAAQLALPLSLITNIDLAGQLALSLYLSYYFILVN